MRYLHFHSGSPESTTPFSRDDLLQLFDTVDKRNRLLGWARYDWRDLDSHPLLQSTRTGVGKLPLRYLIRGGDLLAPMAVHRALKVAKQVVPTAFYHVGMAYLLREWLNGGQSEEIDSIDEVCSAALATRLDAEHVCWGHPYRHHAAAWKGSEGSIAPPSCAHHTARLGELLLRAGLEHAREDWVEAGVSAARALLTYHKWNIHDDGTATVSYYPFTQDETINTATDVAALLALIPANCNVPGAHARLHGIVRMALAEQQPDGSWFYCTDRHYRQRNDRKFIDNHHSAQVLQSLGKIVASGALQADLADQVRISIERGLQFYTEHFYDAHGRGYYFPDRPSRPAQIVGYSEGIAALYWALRTGALRESSLRGAILDLVSRMVGTAAGMTNRKTGDVACTRAFGRNYHIQSLRWGSGPLMEAIMYSLLLREEIAIAA